MNTLLQLGYAISAKSATLSFRARSGRATMPLANYEQARPWQFRTEHEAQSERSSCRNNTLCTEASFVLLCINICVEYHHCRNE